MQTQLYPEGGQGPTKEKSVAAPNSLLAVDCGAVFTKVSLFGLVEGQYRLMACGEAPTTVQLPHQDIAQGIIQAIQTIEFITGRHFVDENKQLISPERTNGDGVDLFISTVSAGDPLRLMVMGGVSPALENLAGQAISGLYAQMHVVPSPSYVAATSLSAAPAGSSSVGIAAGSWTPERTAQEWTRQLERIRELQPEAVLIVGLTDGPGGPAALQEACQLLVRSARERAAQGAMPIPYAVIYAGAPQYVEAVRRMLQGVAEVNYFDPLVSQAQLGQISMALGALHEREVIQKLPGYQRLYSWSKSVPVASATSLSSLVRFLAQHYSMNVATVDVGGATTTVMLAGEQGEFIPNVNSGVGIGAGIGSLFQQVGLQRIARWLPFGVSEEQIRQFVLNRMSHPQVLPTNTWELQVMQAFAREAMALTFEATRSNNVEWPNIDLILATGGVLAHAPKYGQIALMLLDALQPRGVTSLLLDRTMLVSQLGAVATVAPIAAVQVNENDAVSYRLGTCVIPFGDLQPGQPAVTVGLEYSDGKQVTIDVIAGSIEVIPLGVNEQALLTLFPAPTVDVGLGLGERARAAEEIDGGLIGLIIDARGRPLNLPSNEAERQARLLQWAQALGA
ncbi:MAG TPA: glutamate mutase L [Ktedonobacteraceae bacterium]|nr:glutamate mutase L [Ktedonobacteraceae bacterium]